MFKYAALVSAVAVVFSLAVPSRPVVPVGSWLVDARHSDAQLITDATTNYGKNKINATVGVARISGRVRLDADNASLSTIDISMYPATSTTPAIGEDGKIKKQWLSNLANHTMVCFHAKGTSHTPDGRLRTSGTLVLTRVDRNVEYNPSEAYSGPVYGPPMVHRMSHEATFVFDSPTNSGASGQKNDAKDTEMDFSGSTKVITEDFPQLFKAVMATYWPPVVQDEKCQTPSVVGEDYSGPHCSGTFIDAPGLPEQIREVGEDYPSSDPDFSAVVGNNLTIAVHLRLKPAASETHASGGK